MSKFRSFQVNGLVNSVSSYLDSESYSWGLLFPGFVYGFGGGIIKARKN